MLNWYKNLYIGDNAKEKSKKTIRKINQGAGVLDTYLITLANNPDNSLEILNANLLLQKPLRRTCPMIIALCRGYEEALEMVETIAKEIYEETGTLCIREWFLDKADEKKKRD